MPFLALCYHWPQHCIEPTVPAATAAAATSKLTKMMLAKFWSFFTLASSLGICPLVTVTQLGLSKVPLNSLSSKQTQTQHTHTHSHKHISHLASRFSLPRTANVCWLASGTEVERFINFNLCQHQCQICAASEPNEMI